MLNVAALSFITLFPTYSSTVFFSLVKFQFPIFVAALTLPTRRVSSGPNKTNFSGQDRPRNRTPKMDTPDPLRTTTKSRH